MKKKNDKKKAKTVLNGLKPGIRPRHILAVKNVGKYGTEAKALEALNYSKSYARNGSIKNTKSWKAVSEEVLPNDLLAQVNLGLLKHKAWQARSSGLDKAYKAKKIYTDGSTIEINKYTGVPDEVIRRRHLESAIRLTTGLARVRGNRGGIGKKKGK